MSLDKRIINDLTKPRFIKKTGKIIDAHGDMDWIIDTNVPSLVDILNADYHNSLAKTLGFNVELGYGMRNINRSAW